MKRSILSKTRLVALAAALTLVPATVVAGAPASAEAATTPARLKALSYAKAQIGDPYRFGAAGPYAFDCSGLTYKSYYVAGKRTIGGHSAGAQYRDARAEGKLRSWSNRLPGDIMFYKTRYGSIYHVAIYAGNGKMIEAPKPGTRVRLVTVRNTDRASVVARP